ncbi:tRNA-specific adenosine deaminase 1 [Megalops cyprinoides]|uniref:tRNA-specific adenosine deaminase 1 n=1 Tax=Megalops cyprinoides TaxID=118141 RepID=UPI0018653F44|nr:tRNA-specific adenosine deaminase 1 [Megalops cyprinoides]
MFSADEIARLCFDRFAGLPRTGKPEPGREWTLLAAVVKVFESRAPRLEAEKEVVAMGTGTKCIGRAAMSPKGDVLNDSHAEIIARRSFVRYLTAQLRRAVSGDPSGVFSPAEEKGKWRLKEGVSFIFYTSHTPCGDASIVPMTDSEAQPCLPVTADPANGEPAGGAVKRPADGREEEEEEGPGKRLRLEEDFEGGDAGVARCDETPRPAHGPTKPRPGPGDSGQADVHRTGAKCVPGAPEDPRGPGRDYHRAGALRVKPGRGEPTLSLSCSDKIARWGILGTQGALLAHYLEEAVCFSAVVVGKCPYDQLVMERALVERCGKVVDLPPGFRVRPPKLLHSGLEFGLGRAQVEGVQRPGRGGVSPCGAAISWCAIPDRPLDVTANGYKQGVTKKAIGTEKSRSLISKAELFRSFLALTEATPERELPESLRGKDLKTYWDYKKAAEAYQQAWLQLRAQVFPLWPRSPRDLLLFS